MSGNTIEDLERLSIAPRLGRPTKAGDTTIRFRTILTGIIGERLLIDPFSVNAETVVVSAFDNRDASLTSPLVYAHDVNAPIIRRKFGEFLEISELISVRTYGATGVYGNDASLAVATITAAHTCGIIYFPCVGGVRTIYRFQTAVSIPRTFEIKVDPGAILWLDHAGALIAPQRPLHAEWFGADSQAAATAAPGFCDINAGSALLTVEAVNSFKVGNGIKVPGAGVAGADLFARIVEINGLVFTLSVAASTTVTGVRCLGDDSIAIQTIIDNCMSSDTTISHVIYVVPGFTQVCQPIVVDKMIRLCGQNRAWDKILGANCSLIQLGASVNFELDHLYLYLSDNTHDILDGNGFTFIDGSIHDCWFVAEGTGGAGDGSVGIDCVFSTTDIYNCIFEAMDNGIMIEPTSGYVNINNCLFYALNNTAIYLVGTNASHIRDVNISNITYPIDQPGGASPMLIRAEYCDNLNISNIAARNQLTAVANYLVYGIYLANCNRVGITNVNMLNAVRTGGDFSALYMGSCIDVNITNFVHIADAGKEPMHGFNITNCKANINGFTIDGADSHAIYLAGTNLPLNIRNGRILNAGAADNTKAAILGAAGITHISDLYMFSTAAYSDYAIDPTGIAAGAYFVFEKCSIDGFVSGLWDVSILPANATGRTAARDLDIGGVLGTLGGIATPSVAYGYDVYVTSGAVITYTNFLNGYPGQELRIITNDANKTFDFSGTNLKGNDGVDYAAASGDALRCFFDGTNWFCEIIKA